MLYRATVVRTASGLYVTCPAIVPGEWFGPCQRVLNDSGVLAVGDSVLVVDVGDPACPDLIIVGKLV